MNAIFNADRKDLYGADRNYFHVGKRKRNFVANKINLYRCTWVSFTQLRYY